MDYYQVVFTIPDRLSSLTLGNRRVMFNLLFQSAWRALQQVIEDEQQFEAAAAMMLHTWNQKLESHVHVHAFVPGGGPSLQDGEKWISSHPPAHETQNRFWLVDADELRVAFRTIFLKGLRRLHVRGELMLDGEWAFLRDASAFAVWLMPLESVKWVTYIQAPPTKETSPDHILKYLARYMTGGPISDRRLLRHENALSDDPDQKTDHATIKPTAAAKGVYSDISASLRAFVPCTGCRSCDRLVIPAMPQPPTSAPGQPPEKSVTSPFGRAYFFPSNPVTPGGLRITPFPATQRELSGLKVRKPKNTGPPLIQFKPLTLPKPTTIPKHKAVMPATLKSKTEDTVQPRGSICLLRR